MSFDKCRDCKYLEIKYGFLSSSTHCKKHNKEIAIDDYACGDFESARGFFDFANTCRECVFYEKKEFSSMPECLMGYWGKKPNDVACGKFKRR